MPRYINPKTTKHGTTTITTVQSVQWNEAPAKIRASGDADRFTSFLAKGVAAATGSISLQDPNQADALKAAAAADLTVVLDGGGENVDRMLTVKGVQYFDLGGTQGHNAVTGVTLGFEGRIAPTDTVSSAITAMGAIP